MSASTHPLTDGYGPHSGVVLWLEIPVTFRLRYPVRCLSFTLVLHRCSWRKMFFSYFKHGDGVFPISGFDSLRRPSHLLHSCILALKTSILRWFMNNENHLFDSLVNSDNGMFVDCKIRPSITRCNKVSDGYVVMRGLHWKCGIVLMKRTKHSEMGLQSPKPTCMQFIRAYVSK